MRLPLSLQRARMGTEITLSFGGLDMDWSKNSRGTDHGMLFQEKDRLTL
jgi:hypothetical protein